MTRTIKQATITLIALALCLALVTVSAFAVSNTTNSKYINGNKLECTIFYDGKDSPNCSEAGELEVTSTWAGSSSRMRVTVESVNYYTGVTLPGNDGCGVRTYNSTQYVDFFDYMDYYSYPISIYSCTDLWVGTTCHSLYSSLEGV